MLNEQEGHKMQTGIGQNIYVDFDPSLELSLGDCNNEVITRYVFM